MKKDEQYFLDRLKDLLKESRHEEKSSKRMKFIITNRMEGHSHAIIARSLGLSKKRIFDLEKDLLKILSVVEIDIYKKIIKKARIL